MQPINRSNTALADALLRVALMLDERGANPHRVQAYLTAADTIARADVSVAGRYAEGGLEALQAFPGIGKSLSSRIAGYLRTGRLFRLEELADGPTPEQLFARVPGIGDELARRIHTTLGLTTLEELEMAAHDGRLARLEGFGARRVQALQQQLNTLLSRTVRRHTRQARRRALGGKQRPPVALLLEVDALYRAEARAGRLPRIAPRRFNPGAEAWLPVLHLRRGSWRFSALFSNTARAHELEKTRDWVVLYAERDGREQQATVVTETRGDLQGLRVVRGREAECRRYYHEHQRAA